MTRLDGTTKIFSYARCGFDSQTDLEGVTTQSIYDVARRKISSTRLGISSTNVLDAAGRRSPS